MTAPFAPARLKVRVRSYARLLRGLLVLGAGVIVVFVSVPHALADPLARLGTFGGLFLGAFGLFLTILAAIVPAWRDRAAWVAVLDGRVALDGKPLNRRCSGAVVQEDATWGTWRVAVLAGSRHPALFVNLGTREHAESFAAAVAPSAIDDVASFRLHAGGARATQIRTVVLWVTLAAAGLLIALTKGHSPLSMLVALPGCLLHFIRVRVDVGTDGLALTWLGSSRFIPFAKLEQANVIENTLVLTLRDEPEPVPILRGGREDADALHALASRIARHLGDDPAKLTALRAELDIPSSDRGAWIARLRVLSRGGYRERSMTPAALWSVLRDPASNDASRASAAALLRVGLDPAGVDALRRSARAALSAPLREELEAIVEDPDPLGESAPSARGRR